MLGWRYEPSPAARSSARPCLNLFALQSLLCGVQCERKHLSEYIKALLIEISGEIRAVRWKLTADVNVYSTPIVVVRLQRIRTLSSTRLLCSQTTTAHVL